ncbi:MAG: pyridoxamine 5'-phosphate oxidase family protein [Micrococcales bacterium]|nr:pyridoxamine 5'-phosphate oxidase family protein [Micrococcales bacterium]
MDRELDIIRRILSAGRYAFVTTRTADGALHSRPLALLDRADDDPDRFDGTLWFFTEDPSSKVADVAAHPEVNVAVGDGKGYLSMSGSASIERDRERIDRLWNRFAEAYFPNGKDDPAVALLRVEVGSIEYWDTDEAAPKKAFELAKGILTRRTPDLGDTGTVQL